MKIKSFKQFLAEEPLPFDHEPEEFDSKAGSYSSAKIIRAFEAIGMKLGKGSSRVAFKVDVQASQFDPKVLREYGLQSFAGMVTTVFKLAINSTGIAQNKAEITNFSNAEDYGYTQYILPILDTSARNKKYEYADEELSNWIQMPLAPPPTIANMNKMFDKMYGENVFLHFKNCRNYKNAREIANADIVNDKIVKQTDQQNEDYQDFISALETLELGIGDLGRPANWGVWNNKLYIIDYGFDGSTSNLYNGSQAVTVYVDGKGKMTMNTKRVDPRRGW